MSDYVYVVVRRIVAGERDTYLHLHSGDVGPSPVPPVWCELSRASWWVDAASAAAWASVVDGRMNPVAASLVTISSVGRCAFCRLSYTESQVWLELVAERQAVRSLEGVVGDLLQLMRRASAALDYSAALKAGRLIEARRSADDGS